MARQNQSTQVRTHNHTQSEISGTRWAVRWRKKEQSPLRPNEQQSCGRRKRKERPQGCAGRRAGKGADVRFVYMPPIQGKNMNADQCRICLWYDICIGRRSGAANGGAGHDGVVRCRVHPVGSQLAAPPIRAYSGVLGYRFVSFSAVMAHMSHLKQAWFM